MLIGQIIGVYSPPIGRFVEFLVFLQMFALPCAWSVDKVLFIRFILGFLRILPTFLETTLSFFVSAFDQIEFLLFVVIGTVIQAAFVVNEGILILTTLDHEFLVRSVLPCGANDLGKLGSSVERRILSYKYRLFLVICGRQLGSLQSFIIYTQVVVLLMKTAVY